MLTFDLFDPEYGRSGKLTINPAFVESVIESERRWNGARCEIALIAMYSGAVHTVWDSSHQVATQIANAQGAQPDGRYSRI